jgi:hypothetical protein
MGSICHFRLTLEAERPISSSCCSTTSPDGSRGTGGVVDLVGFEMLILSLIVVGLKLRKIVTMIPKKVPVFLEVLILVFLLNGATKLQFYTDVYAWYPDGQTAYSANHAQQTASTVEPPRTVDKSFSYVIKEPAYPSGKGPVVLIDEAHNNFHTATGTYLPFADLLRQDGYVVGRAKGKISTELLKTGKIYVIADAQPPYNIGDPPTFSREEIQILNDWVKKGGSLFLITDHMPDPGAIKDLALSFGIEVSNGYVMQGPPPGKPGPTLFEKNDGSLADHLLTKGQGNEEQVRRIATFAGSAFRCEERCQPLLILGEDFRSWMPKKYNTFPPGTPNIDVSGWYQGGVKNYGKGRIAFFAEAAMFTAQIFDNGRVKAGMNHPLGRDNARLLLNILHWLSGLF